MMVDSIPAPVAFGLGAIFLGIYIIQTIRDNRKPTMTKTAPAPVFSELVALLQALVTAFENEFEAQPEGQTRDNMKRASAQTRFMRTALIHGSATYHEAHQWYQTAHELVQITQARREAGYRKAL